MMKPTHNTISNLTCDPGSDGSADDTADRSIRLSSRPKAWSIPRVAKTADPVTMLSGINDPQRVGGGGHLRCLPR